MMMMMMTLEDDDEMSTYTDDGRSVSSSMFESADDRNSASLLYDVRASSSSSSLLPHRPHHHHHHRFFSRPQSPCGGVYPRGLRGFCAPGKLKIVKPLEGSQTLHQWQQLATPHLSNLALPSRGIKLKGVEGRGAVLQETQVYSLSDLEEDDVEMPTASSLNQHSRQRGSGVDSSKHKLAPPTKEFKTSAHFDNGGGDFSSNLTKSWSIYSKYSGAYNKASSNIYNKTTKHPLKPFLTTTNPTIYTNPPTTTDTTSIIPSWLQTFNFSTKVKDYLIKSLSLRRQPPQAPKQQAANTRLNPLTRDDLLNSDFNVGLNNIMYIKRNKKKTPKSHFNHHNLDRLLLEAISSKSSRHHKLNSSSLSSSSSVPTTSRSESECNNHHKPPLKTLLKNMQAFRAVNSLCAGDSRMQAAILKNGGDNIIHKSDLFSLGASRGDGIGMRSQESVAKDNQRVANDNQRVANDNQRVANDDEAKFLNPLPDILMN